MHRERPQGQTTGLGTARGSLAAAMDENGGMLETRWLAALSAQSELPRWFWRPGQRPERAAGLNMRTTDLDCRFRTHGSLVAIRTADSDRRPKPGAPFVTTPGGVSGAAAFLAKISRTRPRWLGGPPTRLGTSRYRAIG